MGNDGMNLAKHYINCQLEQIKQPNLNHIAGCLKIKGDVGGETKWLNISAAQLTAIRHILLTMPSTNEQETMQLSWELMV